LYTAEPVSLGITAMFGYVLMVVLKYFLGVTLAGVLLVMLTEVKGAVGRPVQLGYTTRGDDLATG